MEIQDITVGESWGCRFRTTTFLDPQGRPTGTVNLQLGQAHPGTPQPYEGIGVIQVRDLDHGLVQLQDVASLEQFTVAFEDCWDIDTIEWQETSDE